MLCEIADGYGFIAVWATLTLLGFLTMGVLSASVFIPLYGRPTIETWKYKCNPKFPSPKLVRKEIIHTLKGLWVATLVPAYALTAPWTKSYCGNPEGLDALGWAMQAAFIICFTDFVEYGYHWLGHRYGFWWSIHKHHHHFSNPSPFAVIADEWPDQLCRTLPMLAMPALVPINIDLMFGIFTMLFYGYGVYLHSGYEISWLTTHQPIFNTSYHHYYHHAVSIKGKPIYTGFFVKIWDWAFDTKQNTQCTCVTCRPAEERSCAVWAKTVKPDYSVLLDFNWWRSQSLDVSGSD